MKPETAHYLELLEQRIALLGSLAGSLGFARTETVSLDIDRLELRIHEQELLCQDLHRVDVQIDGCQKDRAKQTALAENKMLAANLKPDDLRLEETLTRLYQVQVAVKKLNSEHQALLRRSRRTVAALLNSYHSFATIYSVPTAMRPSAGERA